MTVDDVIDGLLATLPMIAFLVIGVWMWDVLSWNHRCVAFGLWLGYIGGMSLVFYRREPTAVTAPEASEATS